MGDVDADDDGLRRSWSLACPHTPRARQKTSSAGPVCAASQRERPSFAHKFGLIDGDEGEAARALDHLLACCFLTHSTGRPL